jgi:hypothetical protein
MLGDNHEELDRIEQQQVDELLQQRREQEQEGQSVNDEDQAEEDVQDEEQQSIINITNSATWVESDSMPVPPEVSFNSLAELQDFVNEWTEFYGYSLATRTSSSRRIYLECGKGRFRNRRELTSDTRRRKVSTQKCQCLMTLHYKRDHIERWRIVHTGKDVHNHPRQERGTATPFHRTLKKTAAVVQFVHDLIKLCVRPNQIGVILRRQYPTTFQTRRDLYNIKARLYRELLQHTSTAQAMVSRLQELDFFVRYDSSDEGHLLAIFFVHPEMIKLWRRYPHVLLVDCTFKTNRYKKPLFSIVAMTGSNRTVFVGQGLLNGKDEAAYTWVLTQIADLCRRERIPVLEVIVSDRERAFLRAVREVFPSSIIRLCY